MKKMLLIASSILALSTIAHAEDVQDTRGDAPQGNCIVRETRQIVAWNQFFQSVAENSKHGRCTYGKISYASNSGRIYVNGRAVGRDLSNSEAAQLMRSRGLSCSEYSCNEIGVDRPNKPSTTPPVIVIPQGNGGGY